MVSIPVIPDSVAVGAEVDIVSVTSVNPSVGGIAGRMAVRVPRRQFHCTVGPEAAPAVRSIHYTHRRQWPVAIRDWGDYIFEDEELTYAAGGIGVLAPLRRLIQPAPGTRYLHQRVLLPDERYTPAVIKVDGTPLSRDDWTFDNYGIANMPSTSGTVTWSGQALVPAMFLDDTLSVSISVKQQAIDNFGVQSIPQVRFEEIFEEELNARMAATDDSI